MDDAKDIHQRLLDSYNRGYEACKRELYASTAHEKGRTMDDTKEHAECAKGRNEAYVRGYEACRKTYANATCEEISALDMDLLTILSRIHQARHLIENIDPMAERILTCDAPRLAGHLTDAAMAWCERTDLDTEFPEWLREIQDMVK